MPTYTIANAKDDLTGLIHGAEVSKIKNINSLFRRAANNLLTKIDPPETMRLHNITVHEDVYNYDAPSDLKGDKIITIGPQVNREEYDSFFQRGIRRFEKYKTSKTFAIRYKDASKVIRLSRDLDIKPSSSTLHNMNSLTANGTWSADGTDASNLTLDENNYKQGNGCLNFDLLGVGTTGYVENDDMDAVDLDDHDEKSSIFAWVYIPDTSIITNFILRWGNDSSNYWSDTVTSPYDQSTFKTGWQLLEFEWNGATETGTVDPEEIDYLRITVTYDGTAETDLRVDEIFSSVGEIYEVIYYSKYLFRSSGGTWAETTSEDSDILNLDTDGYNLFTYETALAASQQIEGEEAGADITYFQGQLDELYAKWKVDHPSEHLRKKFTYYRHGAY